MLTSAPQIQLQQLFETSQFGNFANIEASVTNSYFDPQTSATTFYKPECSNLGLVNLEQRDDFESYSGVGFGRYHLY